MIKDLSDVAPDRVPTEAVKPRAHLKSDEWKPSVFLGRCLRATTQSTIRIANMSVFRFTSNSAKGSVIESAAPFQVCSTTSVTYEGSVFNENGFGWS